MIVPRPEDLPDDIRALSHRHAYELTDKRWKIDVDQLVAILEKVLRSLSMANTRLLCSKNTIAYRAALARMVYP